MDICASVNASTLLPPAFGTHNALTVEVGVGVGAGVGFELFFLVGELLPLLPHPGRRAVKKTAAATIGKTCATTNNARRRAGAVRHDFRLKTVPMTSSFLPFSRNDVSVSEEARHTCPPEMLQHFPHMARLVGALEIWGGQKWTETGSSLPGCVARVLSPVRAEYLLFQRWRRGEGVEPSGERNARQAGFEDRWGHRAPSSSVKASGSHHIRHRPGRNH